jgi:ABC-type transport system involved in cytochrome bd biosynthesis fused ATPase/permease subunit
LLDEWNANLDKESQAEIDKAITNVAQKIIVIEIKHKE